MKKFCVLFSLLMSTMVFTACGAGIKYSSDSNSSNSSEMPVGRVVEPIVKPEVRVVREEEQTMLLDDFLEQKNEKSSKLKVKKNIILTK